MIDVLTTLQSLGIEGQPRGDEFVGHCPMHEQRTGRQDAHPSWSINVETGLFLCFSCGYRGSIITLIADLKGVGLEEARTLTVRPDLGTALSRIPGAYRPASRPEPMSEARLSRFSEPPRWARIKRNLTTPSVQFYGVKWNYLTDSWIIPIRDCVDASLMGWQEKSETQRIFRNFPTGIKKSRTLFGYDVFPGGRMIVVESPLDAVRLHSQGLAGAVATFGAVVSRAQVMLMSAADEVVFALDNPFTDDAGRKSSIQLLTETKGVLKSVRFFDYSGIEAKDPGDMTPDEIEQGIRRARSRAYGEAAVR